MVLNRISFSPTPKFRLENSGVQISDLRSYSLFAVEADILTSHFPWRIITSTRKNVQKKYSKPCGPSQNFTVLAPLLYSMIHLLTHSTITCYVHSEISVCFNLFHSPIIQTDIHPILFPILSYFHDFTLSLIH